jgi:DNA-binding NtrC family response regulator
MFEAIANRLWRRSPSRAQTEAGLSVVAAASSKAAPTALAPVTCEPFVFVIDDEASICHFVAKTLAALGVESETFHTAKDALAALDRRSPALMLLDVALMQSDAVDVVRGLGEKRFGGIVHLMSGGNPTLIDAVQRIGARHGVTFGTPLHKPFRRDAISELVAAMGFSNPAG